MQEKRIPMGITLPPKLVGKLDSIRTRISKDREFAGRDRSYVIEILVLNGLEARKNGEL